MINDKGQYQGSELEFFAKAHTWKSYVKQHISPHLGSEVLEVGAGIGAFTRVLCKADSNHWVCLEPDQELAQQLDETLTQAKLRTNCEIISGTIKDIPADKRFDSILYLDVLEHVEDHAEELNRASALLKDQGSIIVLAPAYQWLFTEFDQAIGHFRRYTKQDFAQITPPLLILKKAFYLDAVGVLASLGNKLLLKRPVPTHEQITFWDKCLVPASKLLDPLLGHCLGRSIVGIWQKQCNSKAL